MAMKEREIHKLQKMFERTLMNELFMGVYFCDGNVLTKNSLPPKLLMVEGVDYFGSKNKGSGGSLHGCDGLRHRKSHQINRSSAVERVFT